MKTNDLPRRKMPERIANPLSIVATVVVVIAVVLLGVKQAILGTGVVSVALQILGLLVVTWARLTFGIRSFHFSARPDARWTGHQRAISVRPQS